MREELQPALSLAKELSREELVSFIGELAMVQAVAQSRLCIPQLNSAPDQLLSVGEAATRLHVSEDFLYRRHKRLPFTRRQGRKLLFSANGISDYLRRAR